MLREGGVLDELRRVAAADPAVAGVMLHGSRALEGFARPDSDYDLVVVVEDDG